jgi:hypothetical protein
MLNNLTSGLRGRSKSDISSCTKFGQNDGNHSIKLILTSFLESFKIENQDKIIYFIGYSTLPGTSLNNGATTLSITKLSITTFSIATVTLSIMGLDTECCYADCHLC